jgi:hypothetical protein
LNRNAYRDFPTGIIIPVKKPLSAVMAVRR